MTCLNTCFCFSQIFVWPPHVLLMFGASLYMRSSDRMRRKFSLWDQLNNYSRIRWIKVTIFHHWQFFAWVLRLLVTRKLWMERVSYLVEEDVYVHFLSLNVFILILRWQRSSFKQITGDFGFELYSGCFSEHAIFRIVRKVVKEIFDKLYWILAKKK